MSRPLRDPHSAIRPIDRDRHGSHARTGARSRARRARDVAHRHGSDARSTGSRAEREPHQSMEQARELARIDMSEAMRVAPIARDIARRDGEHSPAGRNGSDGADAIQWDSLGRDREPHRPSGRAAGRARGFGLSPGARHSQSWRLRSRRADVQGHRAEVSEVGLLERPAVLRSVGALQDRHDRRAAHRGKAARAARLEADRATSPQSGYTGYVWAYARGGASDGDVADAVHAHQLGARAARRP